MCLVSFVLPAYKAPYLSQAIASIIEQSYTNWELIIVDDASPEDLRSIVNSFDDPRIRYYRNTENIGGKNLVQQWNLSIGYASGDYIVLAADDDTYHPDFLETCVKLAQSYPQVDLIRAQVGIINEENNLVGIDGLIPEYCSKHAFLYYWLRATILTCIGNYMFKSIAIKEKKFVYFPSAFCSDAATSILLSANGMVNTKEMLFNFRISTIHLSSSKTQLDNKLKANTLFYQWLLDLNYEVPKDAIEHFFYRGNNRSYIYGKCLYDYYNQVIKYLPWSKFYAIRYCKLLSKKDKVVMLFRFCFDSLFKNNGL
ncbi:glycosyltransferase family 2 protein [Pedobacter cryoconitis]|uniref:Glycosyltransferase involved in cell wall biosynthesis n=1 Tax=Pedobacter cryoconitis TaxID=188932 RepID=A0A7X0MJG5_9SPHI|nr:glycosyltransferase family 2 protein [Pedobacter cryoconitis]MBB6500971.1 glycosyltransferase involved in cell wall biosynthesis [Pedobacter cryoconitis]